MIFEGRHIRKVRARDIIDHSQEHGSGRVLRPLAKFATARTINSNRKKNLRALEKTKQPNLFETSKEHQQCLHMVNQILSKFCADIEVPYTHVSPKIVRTVRDENLPDALGIYQHQTGIMYVRESLRGFELFHTTLHEVIHASGVNMFQMKPGNTTEFYRTGFHIAGGRLGTSLRGFNEGVLELIARHVAVKHHEEVSQMLASIALQNGKKEDDPEYKFRFDPHAYDLHHNFAQDVMYAVAQAEQESNEVDSDALLLQFLDNSRKGIARSYFTGNMMYLRNAERLFGEGTIRFIAAAQPKDGLDEQRTREFQEYFETVPEDWQGRLQIAESFITSKEQFAAYVDSCHGVIPVWIQAMLERPIPEEMTPEYTHNIGLSVGVCHIVLRKIGTDDHHLCKRIKEQYTELLARADEKRTAYMNRFGVNANQVPVRTDRRRRHLTLPPKEVREE